jgi:hypothetical protein
VEEERMTVAIQPPTDERAANDDGGASDAELLACAERLLEAAEAFKAMLRSRAEARGILATQSGLDEALVQALLTGRIVDVT